MGVALRMAHSLSGGVPGILPRTALNMSNSKLILKVDESSRVLIGNSVEKIFHDLADTLDVKGKIE